MLFSEKLYDEGMTLLETNNYKTLSLREVNSNWKLLKGFELSGNYKKCIDFANELVNQANSNQPIRHSLSFDSLIHSSCKLKQTNEMIQYYQLANSMEVHLEPITIDKIIKYLVLSDDWKKLYDEMKQQSSSLSISQEE